MNNLYRCVNFEDLKEGEMILAFGNHVVECDMDTMGQPAYGFVPVDEEILEQIYNELQAIRDIMLWGMNHTEDTLHAFAEMHNHLTSAIELCKGEE